MGSEPDAAAAELVALNDITHRNVVLDLMSDGIDRTRSEV